MNDDEYVKWWWMIMLWVEKERAKCFFLYIMVLFLFLFCTEERSYQRTDWKEVIEKKKEENLHKKQNISEGENDALYNMLCIYYIIETRKKETAAQEREREKYVCLCKEKWNGMMKNILVIIIIIIK